MTDPKPSAWRDAIDWTRCDYCGWPLAETVKEGCVLRPDGMCDCRSMRPRPDANMEDMAQDAITRIIPSPVRLEARRQRARAGRLAEALRRCIPVLESHVGMTLDSDDFRDRIALDEARAALAEHEGGA